jgi:hypothetical protein
VLASTEGSGSCSIDQARPARIDMMMGLRSNACKIKSGLARDPLHHDKASTATILTSGRHKASQAPPCWPLQGRTGNAPRRCRKRYSAGSRPAPPRNVLPATDWLCDAVRTGGTAAPVPWALRWPRPATRSGHRARPVWRWRETAWLERPGCRRIFRRRGKIPAATSGNAKWLRRAR